MNEDGLILDVFRRSGALLDGHFVLRSGRHSRQFFQCALVCEDLATVSFLAEKLLARLPEQSFTTVVAPAMGGLVIGQEVARQAGARFLFVEKVEGALALRRGFRIHPGERILVVEDVITRGGRVQETLDIIRREGGEPTGVAVMADRSESPPEFGVPLYSLLRLSVETFDPEQLPEDLRAVPATKPGS